MQLPAAPILIEADPTRLEQVFGNLLTNAAKYTPEAGEISVAAEVVEPRERHRARPQAVVRIIDTGIGIEPEVLPRGTRHRLEHRAEPR